MGKDDKAEVFIESYPVQVMEDLLHRSALKLAGIRLIATIYKRNAAKQYLTIYYLQVGHRMSLPEPEITGTITKTPIGHHLMTLTDRISKLGISDNENIRPPVI